MTKPKETNGSTQSELDERSMSQGIQGVSLLFIAVSSGLLAFDKIDSTEFLSISTIWATIYLTCHFPIGSIAELKFGNLSIKKNLKEAKKTLKEIEKIDTEIKDAALKLVTLNHMTVSNPFGLRLQGDYQDKFLAELDSLVAWANNDNKEKIDAFEKTLQTLQTETNKPST